MVLPAPFGPTIVMKSCAATVSDTLSTIGRWWWVKVTASVVRRGEGEGEGWGMAWLWGGLEMSVAGLATLCNGLGKGLGGGG